MEIIPPYLRIFQQILKDLENAFPFLYVPKAKAGRKPKLTDIHIAAIFILSYITNSKVLSLAQLLIDLLKLLYLPIVSPNYLPSCLLYTSDAADE